LANQNKGENIDKDKLVFDSRSLNRVTSIKQAILMQQSK